ncbi:MAG: hypothetical protein WCQ41_01165 [Bacillota bacterium]
MKRILLPVVNNDDLNGLTVDGSKGWVKLNAGARLKTIAERLGAKPSSVDDGAHAIPSPIAHIQHYTQNVINAQTFSSELNEWFGLIAIFALRNIYSFKVKFKNIPLDSTFIGRTIKSAMESSVLLTDKTTKISNVTVMFMKNIPVAILHKSIILCPFKTVNPSAFDGVEWYDSIAKEWLNLKDVLQMNERDTVLSGILIKLYKWLEEQFVSNENNSIVRGRVELLMNHLKQGISGIPDLINSDSVPETESVDGCPLTQSLMSKASLKTPIPEECFSQRLMLVDRKEGDSPIRSLYTYAVENTNLTILPPFSDEVASFVNSPTLQIKKVEYLVNLTTSEEKSVTCTIYFTEEGVDLKRSQIYLESDMVYIEDFPYISMWPNVMLPKDMWKLYYLNIVRKDIAVVYNNLITNKMTRLDIDALKFVVKDIENTDVAENLVQSKINDEQWRIYKSEVRAKSVSFKYSSDGFLYTLGQLIIDPAATPPENSRISSDGTADQLFLQLATIGVDFGTTSTNSHIKMGENNQNSKPVNTGEKYLLNISPPNATTVNSFREQSWVSCKDNAETKGKFFTASQLFQNSADTGAQLPYIHGKTIFLDLETLANLSDSDKTLNNKGIFTNLKFSDPSSPDSLNINKAVFVLLRNLALNAALEARLLGANKITFNVSYPFGNVKDAHEQIWRERVLGYVREITNITDMGVQLKQFSEAFAAGQFFKSQTNILQPNFKDGFAIIDIGGGTTDISLWKEGPKGEEDIFRTKASVKYAGGKLVVRTLFQAMRKNPIFKNMWKVQNDGRIMGLVSKFIEQSEGIPANANYWDVNYQNVQSILDVLIEKAEINYSSLQYEFSNFGFFNALIRVKYFSMFYLVAAYLREKIKSGEFSLGSTLKLYMAGCGAKGLKFCLQSSDLTNIERSAFGEAICKMFRDVSGIPENVILSIIPPQTENKEEVVVGLVTTAELGSNFEEPKEIVVKPEDVAKISGIFEDSFKKLHDIMEQNSELFKIPEMGGFKNLVEVISVAHPENDKTFKLLTGVSRDMLTEVKHHAFINAQPEIIPECFAVAMTENMLEENIVRLFSGQLRKQ